MGRTISEASIVRNWMLFANHLGRLQKSRINQAPSSAIHNSFPTSYKVSKPYLLTPSRKISAILNSSNVVERTKETVNSDDLRPMRLRAARRTRTSARWIGWLPMLNVRLPTSTQHRSQLWVLKGLAVTLTQFRVIWWRKVQVASNDKVLAQSHTQTSMILMRAARCLDIVT